MLIVMSKQRVDSQKCGIKFCCMNICTRKALCLHDAVMAHTIHTNQCAIWLVFINVIATLTLSLIFIVRNEKFVSSA